MSIPKKKIVCAHLLNDYSGSPRMCAQVLISFIKEGYDVDIFTSRKNDQGFLSSIKNANYHYFAYKYHSNKIIRMALFFISQALLFLKLLRYRDQDVIFYVNTILPFGAALAGKILQKKVVYHIHETSIKPATFKHLLFYIARKTASDAIYVSKFLLDKERIHGVNCHVVYNALSEDFILQCQNFKPTPKKTVTVLMLSSLKEYKGVRDFVELACTLEQLSFELVINSTKSEIDSFFYNTHLSDNLSIFSSQSNVHPFYQRADLVLNLSHPSKWIETFGMTALEAMSYSIPVIVPQVGGIAELVEDNQNGYKIDVREKESLRNKILAMASDKQLYSRLSKGAFVKSGQFKQSYMNSRIFTILNY